VSSYVLAVARLAQFHRASPDQRTEAQVRAYLVHLTTERRLAASSMTVALSGLRFFYEQTLNRRWTILDVARPQRDKNLPIVLSRDGKHGWRSARRSLDRSDVRTAVSAKLSGLDAGWTKRRSTDAGHRVRVSTTDRLGSRRNFAHTSASSASARIASQRWTKRSLSLQQWRQVQEVPWPPGRIPR
jgi:hypothetical protein